MKKKRLLVRSALAVMAVAAVVAAVTGSTSSASPVGDHYIDNLGTGVTSEGFSNDNSDSDCSTETFLEGDYDLWHFVVNQVDGAGNLSWNTALSVWSSPSTVNVVDVTTQYGSYQPGRTRGTCGSPRRPPVRHWKRRTSTTRERREQRIFPTPVLAVVSGSKASDLIRRSTTT